MTGFQPLYIGAVKAFALDERPGGWGLERFKLSCSRHLQATFYDGLSGLTNELYYPGRCLGLGYPRPSA